MRPLRYILLLFALLLSGTSATVTAQEPQDKDIRVSLLTCGPGEEIYNLFGHTALRYTDPGQGLDLVFNYGIFNFNTPNFVLKFTLGETDYQLGVQEYADFVSVYAWHGRYVHEQVLNLTDNEKHKLYALLVENYKPENRIYRYNYFYDNCSTRPRDKIEESLDGSIAYAEDMQTHDTGATYRSMIHQYTGGHPWSRFGTDMLLGSEADEPISRRQMMFIPFYVESAFGKAQIRNAQGTLRPMVTESGVIVAPSDGDDSTGIADTLTPMRCSLLVLIAILGLTIYGLKRKKSKWGVDLALFAAAGVAGCILTFMAMFSQHPAVGHNWLLFVFHPLHLALLPWTLMSVGRQRRSLYMTLNATVLTVFMLSWGLIPQQINPAILPLALSLWIRSLSNIILSYHKTR